MIYTNIMSITEVKKVQSECKYICTVMFNFLEKENLKQIWPNVKI